MSPRDYASVPERITWTTGFRIATDKLVLGALSTFANFKTGEGARMSMGALTMRASLPRRTVERALHRLESEHWITAVRQHRHATTYRICVERLAENWVGAKVVNDLSATGDVQTVDLSAAGGGQEEPRRSDLSATGDRLSATHGGQNVDLSAMGGGPIPGTYVDPLYDPQVLPAPASPESVPLLKTETDDDQTEGRKSYQLTLGPQEVIATDRPRADWQRVGQIFKDALAAPASLKSRRRGGA